MNDLTLFVLMTHDKEEYKRRANALEKYKPGQREIGHVIQLRCRIHILRLLCFVKKYEKQADASVLVVFELFRRFVRQTVLRTSTTTGNAAEKSPSTSTLIEGMLTDIKDYMKSRGLFDVFGYSTDHKLDADSLVKADDQLVSDFPSEISVEEGKACNTREMKKHTIFGIYPGYPWLLRHREVFLTTLQRLKQSQNEGISDILKRMMYDVTVPVSTREGKIDVVVSPMNDLTGFVFDIFSASPLLKLAEACEDGEVPNTAFAMHSGNTGLYVFSLRKIVKEPLYIHNQADVFPRRRRQPDELVHIPPILDGDRAWMSDAFRYKPLSDNRYVMDEAAAVLECNFGIEPIQGGMLIVCTHKKAHTITRHTGFLREAQRTETAKKGVYTGDVIDIDDDDDDSPPKPATRQIAAQRDRKPRTRNEFIRWMTTRKWDRFEADAYETMDADVDKPTFFSETDAIRAGIQRDKSISIYLPRTSDAMSDTLMKIVRMSLVAELTCSDSALKQFEPTQFVSNGAIIGYINAATDTFFKKGTIIMNHFVLWATKTMVIKNATTMARSIEFLTAIIDNMAKDALPAFAENIIEEISENDKKRCPTHIGMIVNIEDNHWVFSVLVVPPLGAKTTEPNCYVFDSLSGTVDTELILVQRLLVCFISRFRRDVTAEDRRLYQTENVAKPPVAYPHTPKQSNTSNNCALYTALMAINFKYAITYGKTETKDVVERVVKYIYNEKAPSSDIAMVPEELRKNMGTILATCKTAVGPAENIDDDDDDDDDEKIGTKRKNAPTARAPIRNRYLDKWRKELVHNPAEKRKYDERNALIDQGLLSFDKDKEKDKEIAETLAEFEQYMKKKSK